MTLVEAFILLQPLGDNAASNLKIEMAGDVVSHELEQLARRLSVGDFNPGDMRSELRQEVLISVVRTGPRLQANGRPLRDAPSTDEAVRAFLFVSLRNAHLSMLRKRRVVVEPLEDFEFAAPMTVNFGPTLDACEAAERRVRDVYSNTMSGTLRESVNELTDIAQGRTTLQDLIAVELGGAPADGEGAERKARNARYKRYQRALEALHDCIDQDQSLTDSERALHRRIVDDLRIRPGEHN